MFIEQCRTRGSAIHFDTGKVKLIAGDCQVHIGYAADFALCRKLFKAIDGKNYVLVLGDTTGIEIR